MYIALVVYIQEFLQAKLNYLNNRWASIFTHQLFHSFRNFPKTFQRYSINIIMMLLLHTFSWEISYRLLWSQHVNVLHSSIWRNYHWNHQHRVRDGNTYVTWFYPSDWTHGSIVETSTRRLRQHSGIPTDPRWKQDQKVSRFDGNSHLRRLTKRAFNLNVLRKSSN